MELLATNRNLRQHLPRQVFGAHMTVLPQNRIPVKETSQLEVMDSGTLVEMTLFQIPQAVHLVVVGLQLEV